MQIDVDRSRFAPPVEGPFLMNLGNRSKNKNFELLLRGFSMWPGRREVPLLVVGNEWSAHERSLLKELGIEQQVHRIDYVDDEYLRYLYNSASAFIFPSLYEGFGIPLLEAMACGCPVVASRIPTTVEVAGEHVVFFEPDSSEGLRDALDVAVSDGRSSARVSRALDRVKMFSWDRAAEQTLAIYHRLAS